MAKVPLQFRLNGSDRAAFVDPADNLLTVLRRGLNDFGPKYGCGQGTCGTCSVLIDGELRLACLTLAAACEGASIETVSGMADGPNLNPLQNAFMPQPSEEEVRVAISGNLCRCTGYQAIVDAALLAARRMAGQAEAA